VYDPLAREDRIRLLETIFETRPYSYRGVGPDEVLDAKVSLSKTQFWETIELGKVICEKLEKHLAVDELDKAAQQVLFADNIAKLGNEDLTYVRRFAQQAVLAYAQKIIDGIDPDNNPALQGQIAEFKRYQSFKARFSEFISFETSDGQVRRMIQYTRDSRSLAEWSEMQRTSMRVITYIAFGALAFSTALMMEKDAHQYSINEEKNAPSPNIFLSLIPVWGSVLGAAILHRRRLHPALTKEDISSFFRGP
jgi:hypothetical protein